MTQPFSSRPRRGLVVYQLVLILLAIVILILVLLYISRRNQAATTPAIGNTTSMGVLHDAGAGARSEIFVA